MKEQQIFSFLSFVCSNVVSYSVFKNANRITYSQWIHRFQPMNRQSKYLNVILLLDRLQFSCPPISSVHCNLTEPTIPVCSDLSSGGAEDILPTRRLALPPRELYFLRFTLLFASPKNTILPPRKSFSPFRKKKPG